MNHIQIPNNALVLLIGISGAGKSTFANKHFKKSSIICPDEIREWMTGNASNQDYNSNVFLISREVCQARLENNCLSVIDATNVSTKNQKCFLDIAGANNKPIIKLLFETPLEVAKERNSKRDRKVPEDIIDRQYNNLQNYLSSDTNYSFTRYTLNFDKEYTVGII